MMILEKNLSAFIVSNLNDLCNYESNLLKLKTTVILVHNINITYINNFHHIITTNNHLQFKTQKLSNRPTHHTFIRQKLHKPTAQSPLIKFDHRSHSAHQKIKNYENKQPQNARNPPLCHSCSAARLASTVRTRLASGRVFSRFAISRFRHFGRCRVDVFLLFWCPVASSDAFQGRCSVINRGFDVILLAIFHVGSSCAFVVRFICSVIKFDECLS